MSKTTYLTLLCSGYCISFYTPVSKEKVLEFAAAFKKCIDSGKPIILPPDVGISTIPTWKETKDES